jgi:hypothetical protein
MAEVDFTNIAQSSISTPSSGVTAIFVGLDKNLHTKDDVGYRHGVGLNNFSTTAQTFLTTATRTYIAGSGLNILGGPLQIGSMFSWTFNMTKTAAGTSTSVIDVAFGTTGGTADTARCSFTKPLGTGVVDEGRITVTAICRGPLTSSGVVSGHMTMTHNLQITGHMTIPACDVDNVSGAFDVTTPTWVGLCLTPGTADVITTQLVHALGYNL